MPTDMDIVGDVLDTPMDVLREQSRLAKLLDDDTWRQNIIRSVSQDATGDRNNPGGVEMTRIESNVNSETVSSMHQNPMDKDNSVDMDEGSETIGTKIEAKAEISKHLQDINPILVRYAEEFAEQDITPDILGKIATDTHLCIGLGMSVGHAVVLKMHFEK